MKRYYVYRHIRLDKNEPFYIGIGAKKKDRYTVWTSEYKRAFEIIRRNNVWKSIVSRTEFEVEILAEFESYKEAQEKEKELIKYYGRIINNTGCLANLTEGGEGAAGRIATSEAIKKTSSAHMISVIHKESKRIFPSIKEAALFSGMNRQTLCRHLKAGNPKCEFKFLDEKLNKEYSNSLYIPVVHKITGEVFISVSEAARHAGIKPSLFDFYLRHHPEKVNYKIKESKNKAA